MRTILQDPAARLRELLSHKLSRRIRSGSPEDPKGFTLHSDRGRGSFLRHRKAEDRSVLAD
jgi:hypothetical protein